LNIRVSNTAPYRADWKGIVERNFRLSNDKLIRWLPGAVYKPRERGSADYRLDAKLDLHQFRQLMILSALDHNKDHRMDWYRMDESMISDHVEPFPLDLWNWGVRHRMGHLRKVSDDVLRLNLLPTAQASVTAEGIYFDGLYYSSDVALKEQWFVKARERGRWKISVAYDPRKLDIIYLRLDDCRQLESCYLVEADKTFRGRDWYEAADYQEIRKQEQAQGKSRRQQSKAAFNAQVEQIIEAASEQTLEAQKASGQQSKRSRVQSIRANRKAERETERRDQSWQLDDPNTHEQKGMVIPFVPSVKPKGLTALDKVEKTSQTEIPEGEFFDEPADDKSAELLDNEMEDFDPNFVPQSQLIDKLRQQRKGRQNND
jgi:putative transposase